MDPRLRSLRLVAITGALDGEVAEPGDARAWGARAEALARRCAPGQLAIQVRARSLEGAALAQLVRAIAAAARPHGALVLVNDRLDVALGVGADGAHLPERGLSIEDARALARQAGLLVGCSRHSAAAAAQAVRAGADLVQLGPIWATPSKEGMGEPLGEAALAEARRSIGDAACVVAVGGVDGPRAPAARAAGAHAVAAIRAAWRAGEQLL